MDRTGVWVDLLAVVAASVAGYFSLYVNVNDKWPLVAKTLRIVIGVAFLLFIVLHDYFVRKNFFEVVRDSIGDEFCYYYTIEHCPSEIRDLVAREKAEHEAWNSGAVSTPECNTEA
jgi:hypothetical protein